ncbi:lipase maturation factor family protein [Cellulosimicrobium sp. NPDC057127]|uniref:lipase maturation factor family protein n=1 Tax=Cellulosimicrobium sp. NPDC057127 TaxID=3346026 RepID=UPI003626EF00
MEGSGFVTWLGSWFWAGDYDVAREVLQRGTAAVLVVAFWAVVRQWPVLLGERGLTPAVRLLGRTSWRDGPSVLRWRCSDRFVVGLGAGGVVLAALLVAGVPQLGPWWLPMVAFLVLWAAYLSVVNAGGRFYGFGWESLLCEVTFLVAFLGSSGGGVAPPVLVLVLARWCLFRVELGAGLIKIRGDRVWRDLSALDYHHETQPLPGPFSWHAHRAPRWWHRVEVAGNHVTQLVVPFAFFAPQPVASWAGALVVLTQLWLVVTGNFAWLNWLTVVLGLSLVSDGSWAVVGGWFGLGPGVPTGTATAAAADGAGGLGGPVAQVVVVVAVTALLLVLSWRPGRNLVARRQLMNASFEPFRLVNAYGAFGSVSRRRDEVVLEGSTARSPGQDDWREYAFRGKPGDVRRRPPQVAPYHLRLDWQMWFLALGSPGVGWFEVLLLRLLEGDAATLRLLRGDPFADDPAGPAPRWVRARLFRYRFTTREERRRTGDWWVRHELAVLVDPVDLARMRALLGRDA